MRSLCCLSAGQRLAGHLHGLAAFHIDDEFFIDCLVLHLGVRLDIT